MRRRRTKDGECARKKYFRSEEAAGSERRRHNDRYLRTYKCSWCDGWHLGHGRPMEAAA